jgi:hypothetical protein
MEKRYMTVSEFAEKHGVPYQSAVRWARKNQIPGVQVTQFGKFKVYMIPEDATPPVLPTGRPTFEERLKAIAAEVLEELGDRYVDFDPHPPAQDSNDWHLTYTARSGGEIRVQVIRRAGQTDDEVKDEIRDQLLPKADGPRRASKTAAKKRGVRAK